MSLLATLSIEKFIQLRYNCDTYRIMVFFTSDTETLNLVVSFDSPTFTHGLTFTHGPTFTHGANKVVKARPTEFKAELRRWYRILKAAQGNNVDICNIYTEEQKLFGGPRDIPERSKVLLRSLNYPKDLSLEDAFKKLEKSFGNKNLEGLVDLAFGITNSANKLAKAQCLFSWSNTRGNGDFVDEHFWRLRLVMPKKYSDDVKKSLWMLDRFGSIGGRSNNGWGSLSVKLDGADNLSRPILKNLSLGLEDCLKKKWPCAFGKDDKGIMIWQCSYPSLYQIFNELAALRKSLNVKGKISGGNRGTTQIHFKIKKGENAFQAMAYCMPYYHNGKNNLTNDYKTIINSWVEEIDSIDNKWKRFNPFTEGDLENNGK